MEAIAKIAAEPFVSGSLENFHIIEHPAGHLTLKRLVKNDVERMKTENQGEFKLCTCVNTYTHKMKWYPSAH